MKYNPQIHHRRSIRLPGYDYSQPGVYFITTNLENDALTLCLIAQQHMLLNRFGRIVEQKLCRLPLQYPHAQLDTFIIMPDHVHLVIVLIEHPTCQAPVTEMVRRFKSDSAREINQARGHSGGPVWKRNYYEYIIRSAEEWSAIREYIATNPARK